MLDNDRESRRLTNKRALHTLKGKCMGKLFYGVQSAREQNGIYTRSVEWKCEGCGQLGRTILEQRPA